MVQMTTTVELNSLSQLSDLCVISLLESSSSLFHEAIQIIHIGYMMLAIMEGHKMLGDNWLKTVHWIWQRLLNSFLEAGEGSSLNKPGILSPHLHVESKQVSADHFYKLIIISL